MFIGTIVEISKPTMSTGTQIIIRLDIRNDQNLLGKIHLCFRLTFKNNFSNEILSTIFRDCGTKQFTLTQIVIISIFGLVLTDVVLAVDKIGRLVDQVMQEESPVC